MDFLAAVVTYGRPHDDLLTRLWTGSQRVVNADQSAQQREMGRTAWARRLDAFLILSKGPARFTV